MSDLLREELLSMAKAGRSHPATKDLNAKTLTRWRLIGVRGVKLEAIQVGGRLKTSIAAIDRFLATLNESPSPPPDAPRSPSKRHRESAAAAKQLEAVGA